MTLLCVCVCVYMRAASCRVGNMLFSVETQTTEERTQQYQSEIENLYKDLTAKGKALMLSTELGVGAPPLSPVRETPPLWGRAVAL